MPRVVLPFFLIAICQWHVSIAVIRNGYASKADQVENALCKLRTTLASNTLSAYEKKSIRDRMRKMVLYLAFSDATDALLAQFKAISPELYDRIDSLKDAKSRPVDVYVKIILREKATIMAAGVTRMLALEDDRDACSSEYGRQTVSIEIWAFASTLITLAHEMGHVAYQVPNFAQYLAYYQSKYHHPDIQADCMGHEPDDNGGRMAILFEREFKHDRALWINDTVEPLHLDSAPVLVLDAQKRISSELLPEIDRLRF